MEGRPVAAGLLTVPHKEASDRLIIDRRLVNAVEKRLSWATLPSGAQIGQLRIPTGYALRGSGDDLSNFFYFLENPRGAREGCAIGRRFHGSEKPGLN